MARVVGISHQNFEQLIQANCFYIDKTGFIKEWWENRNVVTLLTRPRRFGKALNMSMLEQFFSLEYTDRGDLFQGVAIWEEESSDGENPPESKKSIFSDLNKTAESAAHRCPLPALRADRAAGSMETDGMGVPDSPEKGKRTALLP